MMTDVKLETKDIGMAEIFYSSFLLQFGYALNKKPMVIPATAYHKNRQPPISFLMSM